MVDSLKDTVNKLSDAVTEACILSGAIDFARTGADASMDDARMSDIMYVISQFADKVAKDLVQADIDLNHAIKMEERSNV